MTFLGGTTHYTWDARNRLVGINGYQSNCASLAASFRYDALDRRIQKTINGRTMQYLYDGNDIVQEIENGVVTVHYVRTLNIDEPLARIEADGTVRYYLADALGSIIAMADDTGTIVTQYAYEPFGNTTIIGEVSDNPFQYTGRENDGTGLYYYRARYYNPELQRFISEDPIGLKGGDINFYAYVKNRPTMLVDPMGNRPETPGDWLTEINRLKKAGKLCYECNDIEKHMNPPKSNGMHRECIKCCVALSKIYEGIINLRDSIRDACLEKLCMPK